MINPNSYYTVQAWMVNDLGLHGNELALYAIIYGFSQDGRSAFTGSISYIEEWLGCTRKTAIKAISNLVERGLVIKKASTNGVDTNTYRARLDLINGSGKITPGVVENFPVGSGKITPGVVENFPVGSGKITPNNYIDNYLNNNRDIEKSADGAPAPSGEKGKDKAPVKHRHGEYQNVLLTDEELDKLKKQFPDDLAARIERLSEYIASTGRKYKSHYATIRSWANKDRQAAPGPNSSARRRYGGPAANVGPNGIPIDPSKNDLDGIF